MGGADETVSIDDEVARVTALSTIEDASRAVVVVVVIKDPDRGRQC